MDKRLQVLIVEDSENDALLLELELQRSGFNPACNRVETPEALADALQRQVWDVVIADYVMPHFNGLAALSMVKERVLDMPFIIVSGHITDDTAVAAMKAGAHDYVMKDNLARLGPAVQRELREAETRRERRRGEDRLKVESAFRRAIESSVPSGISAVDLEGRQTYVNPAFCAMVGWSDQELVGARPPFVYWPPEDVDHIHAELAKVSAERRPSTVLEMRFRRRYGDRIHVLLHVTPLRDHFGNITGWVSSATDVTERKRAEIRLAAEHAITRILANAQSCIEAAPGIVQVLLDALEVEVGTFWLWEDRHEVLSPCSVVLKNLAQPLKSFMEETRRLSFKRGQGVPGRVWQEGKPVWVPNFHVADTTLVERHAAAFEASLVGIAAFPIQNAAGFHGVLEFFSARTLEPDPMMINMMTAIGSEVAQFIQRRDAEEALRRAHDELEIRVQQRTEQLKSANVRLHASMAERRRLESELLEITEKERRRIGLDLHDDLGQKLSGVALMTKGLEMRLGKKGAAEAQEAGRIHTLIQEAMNHASDLAHDLATIDLSQKDLPSALGDLAAHTRKHLGIACKLNVAGPIPPLDPNAVTQLYKITQEALTNAIKHGKARRVLIDISHTDGTLRLSVQNTGVPFPDLKGASTGMGLRIMSYRANLIGGQLEVKSAGKSGTIVTCSVPHETRA